MQTSTGVPVHRDLVTLMNAHGATRRLRRGERVYGAGDPVDHWYHLESGMARNSTLFADGRRRIVDFFMPGDFFGFSAGRAHSFDVEAIPEGTVVTRYQRHEIERLAESDSELARQIRIWIFNAVSRLETRILILGRVTSREKVNAFLNEMSERSPAEVTIPLLMSRYDIADYLGLSVETVSRALTVLRERGVLIFVNKHEVRLCRPRGP